MQNQQFNEKEQQAAGNFGSPREFREAARVAQQEHMLAGCSKRPFSKAAASEDRRRTLWGTLRI
jgi:hypothetical protein